MPEDLVAIGAAFNGDLRRLVRIPIQKAVWEGSGLIAGGGHTASR